MLIGICNNYTNINMGNTQNDGAVEQIKQEILERYNSSWPDIEDSTGMVQACKDNFKELVDKLIELCQQKL